MNDHSKPIKRQLRALDGEAYRIELTEALRELESSFARWREGEIDCFQLTDLIHEFHQGPNRELYKYYTGMRPDQRVAQAVARGLIAREDVPSEVLEILHPTIQFFEGLEVEQD